MGSQSSPDIVPTPTKMRKLEYPLAFLNWQLVGSFQTTSPPENLVVQLLEVLKSEPSGLAFGHDMDFLNASGLKAKEGTPLLFKYLEGWVYRVGAARCSAKLKAKFLRIHMGVANSSQ